jgi:hypothetical protein
VSRDPLLPGDPDDPSGPPEPAGHVGTTRPGTLVGLGLVGLVLGWALRPLSIRLNGSAPTVGWLPVLALLLVAAIVGAVAWSTHRTLHRHNVRLPPHQAVNRLVLAKACALVGALVAGGYFGYALSWMGLTDADLAQRRVTQSVLAGVFAVLLVAGSLLLERACRVRDDDHTRR